MRPRPSRQPIHRLPNAVLICAINYVSFAQSCHELTASEHKTGGSKVEELLLMSLPPLEKQIKAHVLVDNQFTLRSLFH